MGAGAGARGRVKPARGRSTRALHERWERLHQGDCEPWPDERLIGQLAARHAAFAAWLEAAEGPAALARALQAAWSEFHAGEFQAAIGHGSRLGALGASVANKAAAVRTLYLRSFGARELRGLEVAIERGKAAAALLPDYPNAHYLLALALGRYSQRISILKALAAGLAGQVLTHLERALELEPRHAEAQLPSGSIMPRSSESWALWRRP